MCRRKPGPRCHSHYYDKWEAIKRAHSSAQRRLRKLKRQKAAPSKIATQEEIVARLANQNYHRMREYYSSPYARLKLVRDEMPPKLDALNKKRAAMERAEDNIKDLQEIQAQYGVDNRKEIAAAQKRLAKAQRAYDLAEGDYARRAREIHEGAERWEKAKANLAIQENRDGALREGWYAGALYSREDLKNASEWEGIGLTTRAEDEKHATIKWEKGTRRPKQRVNGYKYQGTETEDGSRTEEHDHITRTMQVETPTFEQYNGHVTVMAVYDARIKQYRLMAQTRSGTFSTPAASKPGAGDEAARLEQRKVGRSALPNFEHRPRNMGPENMNDEHVGDTISLDPAGGRTFATKEEACSYGAAWIKSDAPVATFAMNARERAVRKVMAEHGYTTREAQNAKLAEQKRELEQMGDPTFDLPLSRLEQSIRQRERARAERAQAERTGRYRRGPRKDRTGLPGSNPRTLA